MLHYDIKVVGSNESGKLGTVLQIKITSLSSQFFQRTFWVRESWLQEMHNDLANDNLYADKLPSYPKTGFMKQIFKGYTRTKPQEMLEREKSWNEYFEKLNLSMPQCMNSLNKLCRFKQDALRELELTKEYHNYIQNKKDIFGFYKKLERLAKNFFQTTYRTEKDRFVSNRFKIQANQRYILHIFKLPKIQEAQVAVKKYQQVHSQLTDFTNFVKVESIFTIRKEAKQQNGLMRSIFGAQTKEEIKHEKEDPYILLGLTDEPKYLYICAIEEDFGISLEQEIWQRKKNMEFFTMEEVVEILQSLISAVNFLHQLEVSHNSIKLTNIFYHERVAKLGGLHDPINLFQEKYNQEYLMKKSKDQFYSLYAYQPPEKRDRRGVSLAQMISELDYQFNMYSQEKKGDIWQLGVCMICACTLSLPKDLTEIFDKKSPQLRNLIKQIGDLYGEGISSILALMTEFESFRRAEASELIPAIFSTELVSIKLEYFESGRAPLSRQSFKVSEKIVGRFLDQVCRGITIDWFGSRERMGSKKEMLRISPSVVQKIYIIVLEQWNGKRQCSFWFSWRKRQRRFALIYQSKFIKKNYLNSQKEVTNEMLSDLLQGLRKLESLDKVSLNLRGTAVDGSILELIGGLCLERWKKLTIDIKKQRVFLLKVLPSCPKIDQPNFDDFIGLLDKQKKIISVYTDLQVNYQDYKVKIIQEE